LKAAEMKIFAFFVSFLFTAVAGQVFLSSFLVFLRFSSFLSRFSSAKTCSLPVYVGPCEAIIPRYFFNSTSQSCELFNFGGCDANANNFLTYDACFKTCPGNPCKQEMKIGPCRAAINRYYYDALTNSCKLFSWGGCDANGNNFLSLKACKSKCVLRSSDIVAEKY
jgi:hypothetical protein